MSDDATPGLDAAAIRAFLDARFPQASKFAFEIRLATPEAVELRIPFHEGQLRPGGTIMGPTIMTLADTATYLLILARLGPVAQAVTTHLSVDFLRRPPPRDLIGRAEVLRAGRSLFVARVTCFSEGDTRPVAHASVTYALPRHAGD